MDQDSEYYIVSEMTRSGTSYLTSIEEVSSREEQKSD